MNGQIAPKLNRLDVVWMQYTHKLTPGTHQKIAVVLPCLQLYVSPEYNIFTPKNSLHIIVYIQHF